MYWPLFQSLRKCCLVSEIKSFNFLKFTWEGRVRKVNKSKVRGELFSSRICSLANCGSFLSRLAVLREMVNDYRSCSMIWFGNFIKGYFEASLKQ